MGKIHTLLLLSGAMTLAAVLTLNVGPNSDPEGPSLASPERTDQAHPARSGAAATRDAERAQTRKVVAERRRLKKRPGIGSPEQKAELARRNRLPLSVHQRRSEVAPPKAPSLAGKDPFSRQLRRINGLANHQQKVASLERLIARLSNPAQFGRAALLLGSIDQRRAYQLLDRLVRRETEAERLAAALEVLGQVAPTGALTSASELLNSASSAAVKKKAASYIVALVKQKPYLAYPAISTLKYAAENESDPSVAKAMTDGEEQIRAFSAQQELPNKLKRGQ